VVAFDYRWSWCFANFGTKIFARSA